MWKLRHEPMGGGDSTKFPPNTLVVHDPRRPPRSSTTRPSPTRSRAFHDEHPLGGEQRIVEQNIERMRVGLTFAAAMRAQF